jgi:hypothetical protein
MHWMVGVGAEYGVRGRREPVFGFLLSLREEKSGI